MVSIASSRYLYTIPANSSVWIMTLNGLSGIRNFPTDKKVVDGLNQTA